MAELMRTDGAGQLAGKVAVITGATAGIGLATAKRFVTEGAYVFITGRGQPALDAAVAELAPAVTGVRGDASEVGDLDRLYAAVQEHGRGIDVLVANAGGGGGSAAVADVTPERFDVSAGLTFRGAYFTVQRALPLLNQGATIVLISSIAGRNGTAGHGIYNASKAAVRSLARTLTVELKERGIRVNALSPGPTDTQGFARFAGERAADFRLRLADAIPVGRIGRPEEVASAALFLASAESSFIAGIDLVVDGGMSQV
jgi:NAD(P)-dependent dehydrogenase (short-subunit alcohol dehydrogenase family)